MNCSERNSLTLDYNQSEVLIPSLVLGVLFHSKFEVWGKMKMILSRIELPPRKSEANCGRQVLNGFEGSGHTYGSKLPRLRDYRQIIFILNKAARFK